MPRAPRYAFERNYDRVGHSEVSRLSPYLRRRVLSEEEVVSRVLQEHPFSAAEKFIQEVVWRTYWKGHLAANPSLWDAWKASALRLEQDAHSGATWGPAYQAAVSGQTSLACFNDWARELCDTGYLHNHARMWFASVWIFTLKLPWELGALFMFRHLLDGDPASNTLSWRWVAGLHTKGKSYLAKADNIQKYSDGRWSPRESELAAEACSVRDTPPLPKTAAAQSSVPACHSADGTILLVPPDDLSLDVTLSSFAGARAIGMLAPTLELGESSLVQQFAAASYQDACARMEQAAKASGIAVRRITGSAELAGLLSEMPSLPVATIAPSVGPDQPWDAVVLSQAQEARSPVFQCPSRTWDTALYPHARRGFFPFWEAAQAVLKNS